MRSVLRKQPQALDLELPYQSRGEPIQRDPGLVLSELILTQTRDTLVSSCETLVILGITMLSLSSCEVLVQRFDLRHTRQVSEVKFIVIPRVSHFWSWESAVSGQFWGPRRG